MISDSTGLSLHHPSNTKAKGRSRLIDAAADPQLMMSAELLVDQLATALLSLLFSLQEPMSETRTGG